MSSKYTNLMNPSTAPVTQKVDPKQIENSAGGWVFAPDKWAKLDRFLILGSDSSSFYASARELTFQNMDNLNQCLQEDGPRTVRRIVEIRSQGRAPKVDPSIAAIVWALKHGDQATRRLACDMFSSVVITGSDLLMAMDMLKGFRLGSSRLSRRAIEQWYTKKLPKDVAYQVIKYRSRNNKDHKYCWSYAHGKHPEGELGSITRRFKTGWDDVLTAQDSDNIPQVIKDFVRMKSLINEPDKIAEIISSNRSITWEMVPTEVSNNLAVQWALLRQMPINAMIRNLAKYTASGLFGSNREAVNHVVSRLTDVEAISRSRIHPLKIYVAIRQYATGHGNKGSLTWTPLDRIVDALEKAFSIAMTKNVLGDPNREFLVAVDTSGSMHARTSVAEVTAREIATVMSYIILNQYPNSKGVAFADNVHSNAPRALGRSLSDYVRDFNGLPSGGTDCSSVIYYARTQGLKPDGIVCLTDSETWKGGHWHVWLNDLRRTNKKRIKSILCPLVANRHSINNPDDADSMEIVGFDASIMDTIEIMMSM